MNTTTRSLVTILDDTERVVIGMDIKFLKGETMRVIYTLLNRWGDFSEVEDIVSAATNNALNRIGDVVVWQ